ncbi:MAG TPA: hypothetical protein VK694_04835 [Verrucomicrobiae bacterium]|nr:hypothetical protein [Verrucomicrobiae bacterium]
MSQSELVCEFREVVDAVIATQVEEAHESGRTWPGYTVGAMAAGLLFASAESASSRQEFFGHEGERIWGVATQEEWHPQAKMYGRLIIVSVADDPEQLHRKVNLRLPPAIQAEATSVHSTLSTDTQIRHAVQWIKSPHLARAAYAQLNTLDEDQAETAILETRLLAKESAR